MSSEELRQQRLRVIAPRVFRFARPYIGTLLGAFIALGLGSGINLLLPWLVQKLLNRELGLSLENDLPLITIGLVALFGVQAFVFYFRHYCFSVVGFHIVADIRAQLFQNILRQDPLFFDRSRTGDLISRLSSDCELVQRSVTTNISAGVRYLLQVIGGVALMCTISLKLTSLIVVLIPVLVLASIAWAKKLRRYSKQIQSELGEATIVAEEAISSARTVKAFSAEEIESARYNSAIQHTVELGQKRTTIAALFSSSMVFLVHSSIAVTFAYGASLVLAQEMSVGDLSAFLLYCVIVAASFGFLAGAWDEFQQAIGAGERIFEIIDHPSKITSPHPALSLVQGNAPVVEFRDVSFEYETRPGIRVLDHISFEVKSGETVALVGPSGAGKSTIASLLLRLYDVSQGEIRFGGTDIRKLDLNELRNEITVVAQDPQVFSISIEENIRFGRPEATDEEVREAAKLANVHTFAEKLPNGYKTLVGNRGTQLSGGERQRITIARALLRNPKFLILDEATSSLDSENEFLIQQALKRLMEGRTTLVIAHRLSTVHHANLVIVLKNGRVEQTGTHQSLLSSGGLYRSLVEHQLL